MSFLDNEAVICCSIPDFSQHNWWWWKTSRDSETRTSCVRIALLPVTTATKAICTQNILYPYGAIEQSYYSSNFSNVPLNRIIVCVLIVYMCKRKSKAWLKWEVFLLQGRYFMCSYITFSTPAKFRSINLMGNTSVWRGTQQYMHIITQVSIYVPTKLTLCKIHIDKVHVCLPMKGRIVSLIYVISI